MDKCNRRQSRMLVTRTSLDGKRYKNDRPCMHTFVLFDERLHLSLFLGTDSSIIRDIGILLLLK